MKQAIITGMNGTVAPVVAKHLEAEGIEVIPWDRKAVPPEDRHAVEAFVMKHKPRYVLHLAMGSPAWAEQLAQITFREDLRYLFTSTVSVFSSDQPGPYTVDVVPAAADDYGAYKIECERRVRKANPRTIVARLAWQIGDAPGSNNMIDFFAKEMSGKGVVKASSKWIVSTAYLDDTAEALSELIRRRDGGTYQLEGNHSGLSFFEIATRLNEKHGNTWKIDETQAPSWDNRMVDDRIQLTAITQRI